jgi:hypothetical protein
MRQPKKAVALAADQATSSASSFSTPALVVTAEALGAVEDRMSPIMVLAHLHPGTHEVRTQRTWRDLQT